MRFLQTSDWHLGKTFHEISLYEDQKFFLSQIKKELKRCRDENEPYSGLLIPGDIYDRPVPPAESVTLLSSFLMEIHREFPDLEIFILSGNHDSQERLSFLNGLLDELKIHICTDVNNFTTPYIIEKNGEKCAVYQLPFLYPGAFFDENGNSLKKQDDLYKYSCSKIKEVHQKKYNDAMSLLCAHLMTVKSIVSDSERSFVGTAEEVNSSYFECFDYAAIGHLHSFQTAGKNHSIVYSGSPLAYSFDDKLDRWMIQVDLIPGKKAEYNKIPIQPLHRVTRLKGDFKLFYGKDADNQLITQHKDDYIEIICSDTVVPEGAVGILRNIFPNLLSFRKEVKTEIQLNTNFEERNKAVQSDDPETIFNSFINEIYDSNESELYDSEKKEFLKAADENGWRN